MALRQQQSSEMAPWCCKVAIPHPPISGRLPCPSNSVAQLRIAAAVKKNLFYFNNFEFTCLGGRCESGKTGAHSKGLRLEAGV